MPVVVGARAPPRAAAATRRHGGSRRPAPPAAAGAAMGPYVGLARGAHVAAASPSLAAAHPDWMGAASASVARAAPRAAGARSTTRMMPVGVPRVPYRLPKGGAWVWIDIWNVMYRDRIIFLQKPVDDELANQLVATMLYLDSEDKKDIRLYINVTGGDVVPCLALHDTMRYLKSDVGTVGFGACMGMAGFLLAAGAKGKRCALPNTRIMLHHPSGATRGQAADIDNEARELMRSRNYVNRVLSKATGKDVATVQRDFNRNKYFNAEEALAYGVIDRILPPPRTLAQELARAQEDAAKGRGREVSGGPVKPASGW